MIKILRNGKLTSSDPGGTYDGEKSMGDLSSMRILSSDSNKILDGTYKTLTGRAATLFHTYPPAKNAVNKQTEYAIGPGLVFRSQPDYKTLGIEKDKAVELGKEIQKLVNFYQEDFNLYEKQSVMFRTALFVGDSLAFFERQEGLLTDIIEFSGDQIDSEYDRENYTLGIKHDNFLRREGIIKTDGAKVDFQDSVGNQNLVQFYIKDLARQLRGYPLNYSILNLAYSDDTFSDAIVHRAVMESIIIAFFKGNGTDLNKQLGNLAEKNKQVKTGTGSKDSLWTSVKNKLGSGNIITANNTEDMDFMDMKAPGNNFEPFKDWILKYIAMGTGTPPEVIAGEYSTSFTAHKGALNDFIKSYMKKRKTFERTVMNVIVREIVKDAVMRQWIVLPGFLDGGKRIQSAYLQGMYLGPVPGHINPLVEVRAEIAEVEAEFDLRSNKAAQRGNEWDIMSEEWAQEQDKFTDSPQEYNEKVFEQETGGDNENN